MKWSGSRANGAFSRKSSAALSPFAIRETMNPPPPMLPALGSTTARANPTATAASTALPPERSTSSPTRVARTSAVTTMPFCPTPVGSRPLNSQSKGKADAVLPVPPDGSGPAPGGGVHATTIRQEANNRLTSRKVRSFLLWPLIRRLPPPLWGRDLPARSRRRPDDSPDIRRARDG